MTCGASYRSLHTAGVSCWGDQHSFLFLHRQSPGRVAWRTSQLNGQRAAIVLPPPPGSWGAPQTASCRGVGVSRGQAALLSRSPLSPWVPTSFSSNPRFHTRTRTASGHATPFLPLSPSISKPPSFSFQKRDASHLAFQKQIPRVSGFHAACLFIYGEKERKIDPKASHEEEGNKHLGGGLCFFP